MNAFVVRKTATLPELALQANISAIQAYALSETIASLADDQEDLQDYKRFARVGNLMWVLQDLLEQQASLCEQLNRMAREQAKAREGQV